MDEVLIDIQLQAEKNIPTTEILVEVEIAEMEYQSWLEDWMEWAYEDLRYIWEL